MTETVELFQRANGTTVLCCAVNLRERHLCNPIARPAADGLRVWCRECKTEHLISWPGMLAHMEKFLTPAEFARVLKDAAREEDRQRRLDNRGRFAVD